jgi:hypothetical protein
MYYLWAEQWPRRSEPRHMTHWPLPGERRNSGPAHAAQSLATAMGVAGPGNAGLTLCLKKQPASLSPSLSPPLSPKQK